MEKQIVVYFMANLSQSDMFGYRQWFEAFEPYKDTYRLTDHVGLPTKDYIPANQEQPVIIQRKYIPAESGYQAIRKFETALSEGNLDKYILNPVKICAKSHYNI